MFVLVSLEPRLCRVQFLGGHHAAGREVVAAHFEPTGPAVTAIRALRTLRAPATLVGPAGGPTRPLFADAAFEDGFSVELVDCGSPTPLDVRQHAWDATGELVTATYSDPPLRITSGEMRDLMAAATALLPRADALLLCGARPSQGAAFLFAELVGRAAGAGVPCGAAVGGELLGEVLRAGCDRVVVGSRELTAARAEHGVEDQLLAEGYFAAGGGSLVVTNDAELVEVLSEDGVVRLRPPAAADRGGPAAREALLAGMMWRLVEGWDLVPAICYGVGAGTAQKQKEIGGRLSRTDVEGFYTQVRRA